MNPYDFVPCDLQQKPTRRKPIWHNVLAPDATHPGKLYSGSLCLDIMAEMPLFIQDTAFPVHDSQHPGQHIRNKQGQYIIPGSSIKGMLRTVVETLCSGCLTGYEGRRTLYPAPEGFAPCRENNNLCISCRLFGMMAGQRRNAPVFLGKVSAEDALAYPETLNFDDPLYTAVLDTPKPRHRAFYLTSQGVIAGRKFYFHQHKVRTESRLLPIRNQPGEYRNHYIKPIQKETWFSGRLNFRNLEVDEFAALLLALTLQGDMRHKIGYGKPIGLGSIFIEISELSIIDYSTRYMRFRSDPLRGFTTYGQDKIQNLIKEQMASFDQQVCNAWRRFGSYRALSYLHDIWQWPPDPSVEYCYPSKAWFDRNKQAQIADTRDLFPGD